MLSLMEAYAVLSISLFCVSLLLLSCYHCLTVDAPPPPRTPILELSNSSVSTVSSTTSSRV